MPDISYLSKYPPFKTFDATDLEALGSVGQEKAYKKDELVFDEDSKGDSMYILKSGAVKILKKVKNQENTIAVLNPGEFFGEMALLDGQPRSAAVKATADSDVFVITLDGYQQLRKDKPHTALKLMDIIIKVLSNRLRQANKNLEVISFWIE
ncbi:MAG TPA: cyclic nucleotide-binding domain-containing protein [bacterium]|nr:cyclic nucleotide-binding domain-containing protein [bacterium]